ncbi:transposase [bacterium]|nr:transposase [Desulfobacterales bacterium]MDC3237450.1 transposase [bacterium]
MPRGPRLDAPGTLHHVIVRGIEKRKIVNDDTDREDFVTRMGAVALDTKTSIYAWALMTNHAHILLRSSSVGLPTFMRRLLSGYAISYNLRHKRYGHLFQNRYKSIICEEDTYFRELVRYIHLNPLRAGMVETVATLERYRWCGHSVIMNRYPNDWQDRKYVLQWFGEKENHAKKAYKEFVDKGIPLGKRPELTGGGLIRSQGGWSIVKAMRSRGHNEQSDARILGSGEFVLAVINNANEKVKYQLPALGLQDIINGVVETHCRKEKVTISMLQSGSRRPPLPKLRKAIASKLVNGYGVSLAETARRLGISTSGVAQILKRNKA